jgi:hypothetical protein
MAIIASSNRDFVPAPEGLHQAVCVDVVDLGLEESRFEAGKKVHKVRIAWQIEECDQDTGKPFLVTKKYTLSLNEKASLRKDLECWRARKFTPEELKGFDLEKLLGVNCQMQIQHETKEDRIWANITAIVPPAKTAAKLVCRGYTRVKDRETLAPPPDSNEITDDDIPF